MAWKDERIFTNEQIKADNVLLINEDWEKLGTYSREDALAKAEEEEKDLVQLSYDFKKNFAVAKVIEFGKFMYQKKKEEKEKKKQQKTKDLKEVKFSYNIWENDLQLKLDKAEEFLKEWHPVKFIWQLRWRENIFANKIYERLQEIEENFSEISKSQGIKKEKKWYSVTLFAKFK